jgi:hypothetical protein
MSVDTRLQKLTTELDRILTKRSLEDVKKNVAHLKDTFQHIAPANGEDSYILNEFEQILETQTLERTKYYVKRLKKSLTEIKTGKINDLNLNRWKQLDHVITDSLWVLEKRDRSGVHNGSYWGNFIPQIPHQLMLRYTKKGDWVVDTFAGSGTTLLECQRLGRNGLGVELQPEIASKANDLLKRGWHNADEDLFSQESSNNEHRERVTTTIEVGDSTEIDFAKLLKKYGAKSAQLLILHPPYHDIIKFSDNPKDLSNAKSTDAFLEMFGKVIDKTYPILDKKRYLAVVIGDKYSAGEWIPLGFRVMDEILKRKFLLKSIVIKNFDETRGKMNQKELWRYRALVGGFYVFKHEYILLFQKTG